MSIQLKTLSPIQIQNYTNSILSTYPKKTSSKSSKTDEESLQNLSKYIEKQNQKESSPEYDPELDMIDARITIFNKDQPKSDFQYQPTQIPIQSPQIVSNFAIKTNLSNKGSSYQNDRFTYFTLIESILIANILNTSFPQGNLFFSFGTKKIIKSKHCLEIHLSIKNKTKLITKYKIIYDIKRSFFYIYDYKSQKLIGEIDFKLVGSNNYVEEAIGYLFQQKILIDPVWDTKQPNKIKYQILKIGKKTLDLTNTSKTSAQGMWSFQGLDDPIPFYVIFESFLLQKDHILTTKKIKIGTTSLFLNLKFLNDNFPEPYAGHGKIIIK